MHKYGDYIVAHVIRAGKEVLTHGKQNKNKNKKIIIRSWVPSIHRLCYSHKDGIYRVINWASSCTVLALALLAKGDCTSLKCEDDQF